MKRYVLRFRGTGTKPAPDMARLRSCAGLKVIDDTSNRMVLVESQPETIATLKNQMTNWLIVEENYTPLPDTREKLK